MSIGASPELSPVELDGLERGSALRDDGVTDVAFAAVSETQGAVGVTVGQRASLPTALSFVRGDSAIAGCTGFGDQVISPGDLDGDGRADLVVGCREGMILGFRSSGAGLEAQPTWRVPVTGEVPPLASLGDINGDGLGDFATAVAGAPMVYFGNRGGAPFRARVIDPRLIPPGTTERPGPRFGASLAGAGDINNDRLADVIVGDPSSGGPTMTSGRLWVCFGIPAMESPACIRVLGGESSPDLGAVVFGAGDARGVGLPVFGFAVPSTAPGSIELRVAGFAFDGPDGGIGVVQVVAQSTLVTSFPVVARGVGDLDGDGSEELAAAAGDVFDNPVVVNIARRTQTPVFVQTVTLARGRLSVAGVGDVNGDGRDDLAVGARVGASRGAVCFWPGSAPFAPVTDACVTSSGPRFGLSVTATR